MHALHNQKYKNRRPPDTKIYKGCLRLMKLKQLIF